MRINILSSAVDDLHAGRLFYESQGEGIGTYFFDSLFSDIDSLALYAGVHLKVYGSTTACCRKDFPVPSTIRLRTIWPSFGECLTSGVIRTESDRN